MKIRVVNLKADDHWLHSMEVAVTSLLSGAAERDHPQVMLFAHTYHHAVVEWVVPE